MVSVGNLKCLDTFLFLNLEESSNSTMGFTLALLALCSEQTGRRFRSSTCLICRVCLCLLLLSGNPIWICWGRPKLLRHPGHTLIAADLRPFSFCPEVEWVAEALPARCCETRLLPVPHAARAHGDGGVVSPGLEVDLQCSWRPVGKKKKKISRGNGITIALLTLAHWVYTLLPLRPKQRVTTWNLSMCRADVEPLLNDLTKPSLGNDLLWAFLFHLWNKTRPGRELIWLDLRFSV